MATFQQLTTSQALAPDSLPEPQGNDLSQVVSDSHLMIETIPRDSATFRPTPGIPVWQMWRELASFTIVPADALGEQKLSLNLYRAFMRALGQQSTDALAARFARFDLEVIVNLNSTKQHGGHMYVGLDYYNSKPLFATPSAITSRPGYLIDYSMETDLRLDLPFSFAYNYIDVDSPIVNFLRLYVHIINPLIFSDTQTSAVNVNIIARAKNMKTNAREAVRLYEQSGVYPRFDMKAETFAAPTQLKVIPSMVSNRGELLVPRFEIPGIDVNLILGKPVRVGGFNWDPSTPRGELLHTRDLRLSTLGNNHIGGTVGSFFTHYHCDFNITITAGTSAMQSGSLHVIFVPAGSAATAANRYQYQGEIIQIKTSSTLQYRVQWQARTDRLRINESIGSIQIYNEAPLSGLTTSVAGVSLFVGMENVAFTGLRSTAVIENTINVMGSQTSAASALTSLGSLTARNFVFPIRYSYGPQNPCIASRILLFFAECKGDLTYAFVFPRGTTGSITYLPDHYVPRATTTIPTNITGTIKRPIDTSLEPVVLCEAPFQSSLNRVLTQLTVNAELSSTGSFLIQMDRERTVEIFMACASNVEAFKFNGGINFGRSQDLATFAPTTQPPTGGQTGTGNAGQGNTGNNGQGSGTTQPPLNNLPPGLPQGGSTGLSRARQGNLREQGGVVDFLNPGTTKMTNEVTDMCAEIKKLFADMRAYIADGERSGVTTQLIQNVSTLTQTAVNAREPLGKILGAATTVVDTTGGIFSQIMALLENVKQFLVSMALKIADKASTAAIMLLDLGESLLSHPVYVVGGLIALYFFCESGSKIVLSLGIPFVVTYLVSMLPNKIEVMDYFFAKHTGVHEQVDVSALIGMIAPLCSFILFGFVKDDNPFTKFFSSMAGKGRMLAGMKSGFSTLREAVQAILDYVTNNHKDLLLKRNAATLSALLEFDILGYVEEVDQLYDLEYRLLHLNDFDFRGRLAHAKDKSLKCKKAILSGMVDSTVAHVLSSTEKRLTDVIMYHRTHARNSSVKFDPFHVMFVGASGVGKSAVSPLAMSLVMDRMGKPKHNRFYPKATTDAYWSKYDGQLCVVYDDLGQVAERGNNCQIGQLADIKSNTPVQLNMAAIEEKGTEFSSEFIISTCNWVDRPPGAQMQLLQAYRRRRDALIEIKRDNSVPQDVNNPLVGLRFLWLDPENPHAPPYRNNDWIEFVVHMTCYANAYAKAQYNIMELRSRGLSVEDFERRYSGLINGIMNEIGMPTGNARVASHERVVYQRAARLDPMADRIDIDRVAGYDPQRRYLTYQEEPEPETATAVSEDEILEFEVPPADDTPFAGLPAGRFTQRDIDEVSSLNSLDLFDPRLAEMGMVTERTQAVLDEIENRNINRLFEQMDVIEEEEVWCDAEQEFDEMKTTAWLLNKLAAFKYFIKVEGGVYVPYNANAEMVMKMKPVYPYYKKLLGRRAFAIPGSENIIPLRKQLESTIKYNFKLGPCAAMLGLAAGAGLLLYAFCKGTRMVIPQSWYSGEVTTSVPVFKEARFDEMKPVYSKPTVTMADIRTAGMRRTTPVTSLEELSRATVIPMPEIAEEDSEVVLDTLERMRVKEQGTCGQATRTALRAIRKNQVQVLRFSKRLNAMTGQCGLMLVDQMMLLNYHFFGGVNCERIEEGALITIKRGSEITQVSFTWADMIRLEDTDAAVWRVPANFVGARSIMKQIMTTEEHLSHRATAAVMPTIEMDDQGFFYNTMGLTQLEAVDEKVEWMRMTEKGLIRSHIYSYQYSGILLGGMCGSPIVLDRHQGGRIIGIHAFSHDDTLGLSIQRGGCTLVERQALKNVIDILAPKRAMFGPIADVPSTLRLLSYDRSLEKRKIGSLDVFCKVPANEGPFISEQSIIKESQISKFLTVERKKEPAILSKTDPRLNGLQYDPLDGVAGYGEPIGQFRQDILAHIIECRTAELKAIIGRKLVSFDLETGINGIPGESIYPPLNMTTSAGFPYTKVSPGPKRNFFTAIGEYPNGQKRYALDNEMAESLLASRLHYLAKGEKFSYPSVETAKDETLKLSKIYGKPATRTFCTLPMDLSIATRMFTMDWVAMLNLHRNELDCQVGINPLGSDWSVLLKRLQKRSKYGIDGDYGAFDRTVNPAVVEAVVTIINNLYENEHAKERALVLSEICQRRAFVRNKLVTIKQGMASGSAVTATLNSEINAVYLRYMFILLAHKHAPELANYASYQAHVTSVTYGDDNMMAISEVVLPWFNMVTISEAMADHKLTFTDAAKNVGKLAKSHMPVEELSFLKRSFKIDGQLVAAPLEKSSIESSLHWCKTGNHETLEQVMDTCLEQAVFHGKEYYDFLYEDIFQACMKAKIAPPKRNFEGIYTKWVKSMVGDFAMIAMPTVSEQVRVIQFQGRPDTNVFGNEATPAVFAATETTPLRVFQELGTDARLPVATINSRWVIRETTDPNFVVPLSDVVNAAPLRTEIARLTAERDALLLNANTRLTSRYITIVREALTAVTPGGPTNPLWLTTPRNDVFLLQKRHLMLPLAYIRFQNGRITIPMLAYGWWFDQYGCGSITLEFPAGELIGITWLTTGTQVRSGENVLFSHSQNLSFRISPAGLFTLEEVMPGRVVYSQSIRARPGVDNTVFFGDQNIRFSDHVRQHVYSVVAAPEPWQTESAL